MFPIHPADNLADLIRAYAELPGKVFLGVPPRGVEAADFDDLCVREFRPAMQLPFPIPLRMPPCAASIASGAAIWESARSVPVTPWPAVWARVRPVQPAQRRPSPSFGVHIGYVFSIGSEPDMTGVATPRIVTPMTGAKAIGDFSDRDNPCNPVGLGVFSADHERSVSCVKASASPRPTRIGTARLVNLRPKTGNRGIIKGKHRSSFPVGRWTWQRRDRHSVCRVIIAPETHHA